MNAQKKIVILLTVLLFCSLSGYVWNNNRLAEQQLLNSLESFSSQMQHAFQVEQDSTEMRMLQIASFVAGDPDVQKLFLLGKQAVEQEGGGPGGSWTATVRTRLYRLLEASQAQLKKDYGFRQLQFHLGPGSLSFLRVHHPEKFGDRMDKVRYTIVDSNAEQKKTTGFETGRIYSGIRGVVPVFALDFQTAEPVHVGAVEAGTSYDNMLSLFKTGHQVLDAAVLLSRAHLQANVWPDFLDKLLQENQIVQGYRVESTTSPLINTILGQTNFRDKISQPGTHLCVLDGKDYSIATFALRDYRGETDPSVADAGIVMVWRDVSADIAALQRLSVNNYRDGILFFLLVELLIILGVRFATLELRKDLIRTRKLEAVSERAARAASRAGTSNLEPKVHLQRVVQEQLDDAVKTVEAEFGLFLSQDKEGDTLKVLAVTDMVWSNVSGAELYRRARQEMLREGYFLVPMSKNQLLRGMETDHAIILNTAACRNLSGMTLPEGHPPLRNLLLMPVIAGSQRLGLIVLANRNDDFGPEQQVIVKAYAAAAALVLYADKREIARLLAEDASRMKTEFLSNMSHELRTPLNTVIGLGQLLADSSLNERQQDYLGKINSSSKLLLSLIDQILAITQLDTAVGDEPVSDAFNLPTFAKHLLAQFAELARAQGVVMRLDSSSLPSGLVRGAPRLLEQILRQLLENAIKFSSGGEVQLSVVLLRQEADLGIFEFSVVDQGIGIAPDLQKQVFQPFFQADGSKQRAYSGAGLGLTIAQKICHQLGGELALESALGEGSRFSFQLRLPILAADVAAPLVAGEPDAVDTALKLTGNEEELAALLRKLEEPLSKLQPGLSRDLAEQLGRRQWPEAQQENVKRLVVLIEKYRFAEAAQLLARFTLPDQER